MNKKAILDIIQKLISFKGYGVPEKDIKKRIIDSTYLFHQAIIVLLMLLESYMLVRSIIRYGSNVSDILLYRRYFYGILGLLALIMTVILFFLYHNHLYDTYQKVSLLLPIIIIGWGSGMTVIDCLKGNDISVFTYTILVVSAFISHIDFFYSAGVFVFFTVLLNVLFYSIPQIEYTYGMRVNSIYACVLSFIVLLFVSYENRNSKAMEIKNEKLLEELALANQKLELKSSKDGLTGLYNRMFLAKLEEGSITDNKLPSGIIMLDVDKFKVFNDTYGHLNGDLCLKYIADKLQNIPDEENGYSIRYGGEEFLIIYYEIDRDRVIDNAERIFASIREGSFLIDNSMEKKITVSMGVFTDVKASYTILEMIKCADEALYMAKEQGRDRIVVS